VFAAPVSEVEFDGLASTLWRRAGRWATARKKLVAVAVLVIAGAGLITAGAGPWPARQSTGLPLPDRPSIAVLPFGTTSGDTGQDYLGDGIAQDLATGLSKFSELFVIADNSARKYKRSQSNPVAIGRELGVRYLLQGRVWKDPERVRVSVQLIDAGSGAQIWGEVYDREPSGIFLVQDDITQQIVVRLVSHIGQSELERIARKPSNNWSVYEHYLRGNALLKGAPRDRSGSTIAAAKSAYEKALAIDPDYAPAIGGLAAVHLTEWLNPFVNSPSYFSRKQTSEQDFAALDRAEQLARQAIELDPTLAEAYATLGWVLHWKQGPRAGLRMFERAFELNPNLANGRYANSLSHSGRATEAVAFLERVMRLDPFYPPIYEYFLGKSYFYAGRHEESIERLRVVADALPALKPVLPIHAAVAALTGHHDESRAVAAKLMAIQPDFSTSAFLNAMRLVRAEDRDRLAKGLRTAGLPE
jgi:TolB-like protein/Tfp pilus assembly protein PilF